MKGIPKIVPVTVITPHMQVIANVNDGRKNGIGYIGPQPEQFFTGKRDVSINGYVDLYYPNELQEIVVEFEILPLPSNHFARTKQIKLKESQWQRALEEWMGKVIDFEEVHELEKEWVLRNQLIGIKMKKLPTKFPIMYASIIGLSSTLTKEIIAGNIKIARFMGYEYFPYNENEKGYTYGWMKSTLDRKKGEIFKSKLHDAGYLCRTHKDLRYYNSYDEIMRVLLQIRALNPDQGKIHFEYFLSHGHCRIEARTSFINTGKEWKNNGGTTLQAIHTTVVQFIDWYNETYNKHN